MEIQYIIAISAVTIFIVYWLFIKPLIDYNIYNSWWSQNGGSDCIDITAISYYNSNYLVYLLYNVIQPGSKRFGNDAELGFISNLIVSYAAGIAQNGQIMPSDICSSLVPKQNPLHGGNWPTDLIGWKAKIGGWASLDPKWPTASSPSPNLPGAAATWQINDNFLWTKLNIDYDAPLILAFLTGYSYDREQVLYQEALWPMLGIGNGNNGIIGMVKTISSTTSSVGDFQNYLWSRGAAPWYSPNGTPNIGPNVNTCSPAAVAGSVFSSVTQGIFVAAMIPPPGDPLGIIAGLGVALVGSVVGAAEKKCF